MRWWKWVGLAGLLAVGTSGAVVVIRRRRRDWTEYEPDEIRARLHERLRGVSVPGPERSPGKPSA